MPSYPQSWGEIHRKLICKHLQERFGESPTTCGKIVRVANWFCDMFNPPKWCESQVLLVYQTDRKPPSALVPLLLLISLGEPCPNERSDLLILSVDWVHFNPSPKPSVPAIQQNSNPPVWADPSNFQHSTPPTKIIPPVTRTPRKPIVTACAGCCLQWRVNDGWWFTLGPNQSMRKRVILGSRIANGKRDWTKGEQRG